VTLAATRLGGHHSVVLGSNVVGILDASGHIIGQVPVGGRPGGVAVGAGSVWATDQERGSLVQIDPSSPRVVDTIHVGTDPTGVVVGGGGVWVADSGASTVWWVNASAPSAQSPTPIQVGQGPGPIAYGDRAAWVINTTDATLQRIGADRLKPSHPVPVGGAPSAVAVGGGWVWVTDSSSSAILKVDPRLLRVVARLPVGNDPVAVVYGGGKVWVANAADGTVTRLDPSSGQAQVVAVGRDPAGLAYAVGAVWVAVGQPPAMARVDSALSVSSTSVESTPQAVVVSGGRTWVTALAPPASHRGGTLRVVFDTDDFTPGNSPFDPGVAPYDDHWQVLSLTNDGLVTYRHVGGAAGLQVVPDLAVTMPTVSSDGRTYTFQLRKGIHYSNGRPVRASDFRHAVERQLQPSALRQTGGGFYQSIVFSNLVGYDACHHAPRSCSLASGIQTDDTTGTITIHLTRPDPALPEKLATTFGDLVPPGSPPPDSGRPVPATGPYMVARTYKNGKDGFLLVRNPQFHQWSADAQPAGYPNHIRWTFVPTAGKELTDVEGGTADVMVDHPPAGRLDELVTRYASLAHPYATPATIHVDLNTRVPPFNHLAARRAVNLAVDRGRVVELVGGPQLHAPTCQILPPGMFGYAPYCPYTVRPTPSGTWTAPDLAKAQQLVRSSGTRGGRVVIWTWGGFSFARVAPYLAHLLDQLGYRASAHITPSNGDGFDQWNEATSDSRRHTTASLGEWYADYPNPTDYFDILLTCKAFIPANTVNLNVAELCDPRLDQRVHAAEAAQTSDPAKGSALWQAADREAVTQAAWVPLYNDLGLDVVSSRVGNYQHNLQWSLLLDQLWVR
jgi:peptide/nickel transport system substrate-binding protein